MWIKICANTSAADAQMAVDLGADAVGFVFAPSTRRVTPEEVGGITARLQGEVERVGVFPAWEFEAVRSAVRVAGLSGVQLHGGYERGLLRRLRGEFGDGVTIAQTLHWDVSAPDSIAVTAEDPTLADDEAVPKDGASGVGPESTANRLLRRLREMAEDGFVDRVLVDSKVGTALGGTGQVFDWAAAESLFAQAGPVRMIVAGGLTPENVGEGIGRLRPWGVDVASGVEAKPGKKDPERLRLFLARARAAAEANRALVVG